MRGKIKRLIKEYHRHLSNYDEYIKSNEFIKLYLTIIFLLLLIGATLQKANEITIMFFSFMFLYCLFEWDKEEERWILMKKLNKILYLQKIKMRKNENK